MPSGATATVRRVLVSTSTAVTSVAPPVIWPRKEAFDSCAAAGEANPTAIAPHAVLTLSAAARRRATRDFV
ncbi:MAG: hypothetical protein DI637_01575 [Citromicrobium sp.]|nr:MAG: hypothetical protein DI637_01575 [Citromicrobium sp.]